MAMWCSPSFAEQTIVAAGSTPLNATGVAEGVDFATPGVASTLTVGTQDIFTNNSLGGLVVDPTLLAVQTPEANFDSVEFNGNSTVFGAMGDSTNVLLGIDANDGTVVTFTGPVFSTAMDIGTGTVNFNSGAGNPNSVAMEFTGDGTISIAPNTLVTGALITAADNTGTLVLGSAGQLTGAVGGGAFDLQAINVVGDGVTATIDGVVQAYSYSLGTNTLNITGAFDINNPGPDSITTTLASSSVFGNIFSAGGALTLPGTLGITVLVPATSYLAPGTQFNIVDALISGGGTLVTVTSVNPLYTFSATPIGGTAADGLVTIQVTGIPIQVSPQPQVQALIDAPLTPDLEDVLIAINALTDPNAIIDAVAQLAPSTPSLAAPLVTYQGAREFQDLWQSRLNMCRDVSQPNEINSACPENEPRSGWWAKGFGYFGEQDPRGVSTGYESEIYGGMIAFDTPLANDSNTRAGLGFGYAHSTIDGNKFDASTEFDSYRPLIYIGHERGPWYIHGSGSFGWHEYEDRRHIVFPGLERTAEADYSGQDYTVYANTGYHFTAHEFTLTPFGSLQYSHIDIDGYGETGAGDISLNVESQSYDFVESGLGVKLERPFTHNGATYIPEVHFKWLHEFSDPTLEQTATFAPAGSPSFTTRGQDTDDDTLNVGAGLTLLSCSCSAREWSIEGVYDYDWNGEGYSAHQGTIRFTSRF